MADLGLTDVYWRHVGRKDTSICDVCHIEYVPEEVVEYQGSLVCPFCDVPIGET